MHKVLMVLMIIFVLLALLFAGFGFRETRLSLRSSAEPERISLRELIKRGPDGNPNLILTDYKIVDNYAIEKKAGKWEGVWVPIAPSDATDDETAMTIDAVIFSTADNDREVQEQCDQKELRGMIDPEIARPSPMAAGMWKNKFPKIDLDKCIVFAEGEQPASALTLKILWGGFGVFSLLTVAVGFLARKLTPS